MLPPVAFEVDRQSAFIASQIVDSEVDWDWADDFF